MSRALVEAELTQHLRESWPRDGAPAWATATHVVDFLLDRERVVLREPNGNEDTWAVAGIARARALWGLLRVYRVIDGESNEAPVPDAVVQRWAQQLIAPAAAEENAPFRAERLPYAEHDADAASDLTVALCPGVRLSDKDNSPWFPRDLRRACDEAAAELLGVATLPPSVAAVTDPPYSTLHAPNTLTPAQLARLLGVTDASALRGAQVSVMWCSLPDAQHVVAWQLEVESPAVWHVLSGRITHMVREVRTGRPEWKGRDRLWWAGRNGTRPWPTLHGEHRCTSAELAACQVEPDEVDEATRVAALSLILCSPVKAGELPRREGDKYVPEAVQGMRMPLLAFDNPWVGDASRAGRGWDYSTARNQFGDRGEDVRVFSNVVYISRRRWEEALAEVTLPAFLRVGGEHHLTDDDVKRLLGPTVTDVDLTGATATVLASPTLQTLDVRLILPDSTVVRMPHTDFQRLRNAIIVADTTDHPQASSRRDLLNGTLDVRWSMRLQHARDVWTGGAGRTIRGARAGVVVMDDVLGDGLAGPDPRPCGCCAAAHFGHCTDGYPFLHLRWLARLGAALCLHRLARALAPLAGCPAPVKAGEPCAHCETRPRIDGKTAAGLCQMHLRAHLRGMGLLPPELPPVDVDPDGPGDAEARAGYVAEWLAWREERARRNAAPPARTQPEALTLRDRWDLLEVDEAQSDEGLRPAPVRSQHPLPEVPKLRRRAPASDALPLPGDRLLRLRGPSVRTPAGVRPAPFTVEEPTLVPVLTPEGLAVVLARNVPRGEN